MHHAHDGAAIPVPAPKRQSLYRSKCGQCKLTVEIPRWDYGWYIGKTRFCSYRCMRAWEEKKRLKRLKGEKRDV